MGDVGRGEGRGKEERGRDWKYKRSNFPLSFTGLSCQYNTRAPYQNLTPWRRISVDNLIVT
jgi:hypothetical protein